MMGRPPIYETPEELEKKINEYYDSLSAKVIPGLEGDGSDDEITYAEPATITGLALYLGFESRQSFYDYERKENFSYIIKKARLRIEHEYEKKLHYKNPTGSIFALKNMGWDDRTQIKHEGIPDQKFTYLIAKPEDD